MEPAAPLTGVHRVWVGCLEGEAPVSMLPPTPPFLLSTCLLSFHTHLQDCKPHESEDTVRVPGPVPGMAPSLGGLSEPWKSAISRPHTALHGPLCSLLFMSCSFPSCLSLSSAALFPPPASPFPATPSVPRPSLLPQDHLRGSKKRGMRSKEGRHSSCRDGGDLM